MFGARWRWNASRALAILRFTGGRKSRPHPAHALRRSAGRCLPRSGSLRREPHRPAAHPGPSAGQRNHRQLPPRGHGPRRPERVLAAIEAGAIRTVAVDTPEPPSSPRNSERQSYAYLDDAPLEERAPAPSNAARVGTDKPGRACSTPPYRQVEAETWPDVRNADELHDALLTLVTLAPRRRVAAAFTKN